MHAPHPPPETDGEEYWISVSDLMAGLMVVFLFVAVAYPTGAAATYARLQEQLYEDLYAEFEQDLPRWAAELDRETLAVRFQEPEVFFDQGSDRLKPQFQAILHDFFPRYVRVLRREAYVDDIAEIRIEGHTSSEWQAGVDGLDAYVANMELSQDRTRAVLGFVVSLPEVEAEQGWLLSKVTANGLSSSHLVLKDGIEDATRSRRVEFRVRTHAERRLMELAGGS